MPNQEKFETRVVTDLQSVFSPEALAKEITLTPSRSLVLKSYDSEGIEVGHLNSLFKVYRDVIEDKFVENHREVRLADIWVEPDYYERGIGTSLVQQLEVNARQFGATQIEGIIATADRLEQPMLPDFFIKLGFQINETVDPWEISKVLT